MTSEIFAGKINPNMRVYHYRIDLEGRLWHQDSEITDPSVLKFFMSRLKKDAEGKYRVLCQGELNWIEVEDVPYVVQGLELGNSTITLVFAGGYQETLEEQVLEVGENDALYCKVRGRVFQASFNRKTYFELARWIEDEGNGRYSLRYAGTCYPIASKRDRNL